MEASHLDDRQEGSRFGNVNVFRSTGTSGVGRGDLDFMDQLYP